MDNRQKKYTYRQSIILIGRDAECDLRLGEEPAVSGRHLEIFQVWDTWYIRDMNSTNGTTLNGVKLEPDKAVPLKKNDRIVLAEAVTIVFRPAAPGEVVTRKPRENGFDYGESALWAYEAEEGATFLVSFRKTGEKDRDTIPDGTEQSRKKYQPSIAGWTPGTHVLQDVNGGEPPQERGFQNSRLEEQKQKRPRVTLRESLRTLWEGNNRRATKPDDIQFRAAAPAALKRGKYFLVKLMVYPEADYARADREQKSLGDRVIAAASGIFQAGIHDVFRIRIRSEDFPMEEKVLKLTWNGKYAAVETDIFLPADYTGEQVRLVARVSSEIEVLTDLILILQVQADKPQEVVMEKRPIRTAFASYARADLDKVLARIQGLGMAENKLDVFLDKKDLLPGEYWERRLYREIDARDVFYLFWSRNARNSTWVQKELDYAIKKKGSWFIHPVPLEDPKICPPPEQLQDRHFDDWTLHYMSR